MTLVLSTSMSHRQEILQVCLSANAQKKSISHLHLVQQTGSYLKVVYQCPVIVASHIVAIIYQLLNLQKYIEHSSDKAVCLPLRQ